MINIIYTSPDGHVIKEGDLHAGVRNTLMCPIDPILCPTGASSGGTAHTQTLLKDLTDKELREQVPFRASEPLRNLYYDERLWRYLAAGIDRDSGSKIRLDMLAPGYVHFINKHLSASAEFKEVQAWPGGNRVAADRYVHASNHSIPAGNNYVYTEEGDFSEYISWQVKTLTWSMIFPDWYTPGKERPYTVDYATAVMTMLITQHNVECPVAGMLAWHFANRARIARHEYAYGAL